MKNPSEQMGQTHASSDSEKIQEGSPTIRNIVEGRAKIKFLSQSIETRRIGGKEWTGRAYLYELTVPDPVKPNEEWTTFLTSWNPVSTAHEPFETVPGTQLTIATGKGEMSLTENKETLAGVLEEISRQVSESAQR